MDYRTVADNIKYMNGAVQIGVCSSEQLPLYKITRGTGRKILLLGGVHGDEPAGTFAIIDFFANHSQKYEHKFEFTAFPCVNPWGFEHYARGNEANVNLNREFKPDTSISEMRVIMSHLEQYVFAMDMHETWPDASRVDANEPSGEDPSAFYFWEVCPDKSQRVGLQILSAIRKAGFEICTWDKIYGDKNNGGVIWYPEDCGTPCYAQGTTSDAYLAANHTSQSFTLETPRNSPLSERILLHQIALITTLDLKK